MKLLFASLLLSLLLMSNGCPSTPDQKLLFRQWLHLREADANGQEEYRPTGYAFPPARGRSGVEFKSDGSFAYLNPAPNDAGTVAKPGRWEQDGANVLKVTVEGQSRRLEIVKLTETEMALRWLNP